LVQRDTVALAAEREWDQFHSPKNLAMALAVEAAELMEPFQWLREEASKTLLVAGIEYTLPAMPLRSSDRFPGRVDAYAQYGPGYPAAKVRARKMSRISFTFLYFQYLQREILGQQRS
jgi:hypothetical protein